MTRLRTALLLVAGLVLAGCAGESVWAPDEAVQRAAYTPEGPTRVSLLTAISTSNGSGGHSALLIDGAQRLMFDPAGSWRNPAVPERNDVLYGLTPQLYQFYTDYHARETYYLVVQEVEVSPEVAAQLSAAIQSYGAVPPGQCALSISRMLSETPGFESVGRTWFPRAMMNRFEDLPGVSTSRIYDNDADDNLELLQAQARAARSLEIARANE